MGYSDAVSHSWNGREVADDEHRVSRIFAFAQQRNRTGRVVVRIDPLDSSRAGIENVHGGFAAIETIQLFHPSLHAAMNLVLQHVPFEARVMCPLAHLPKFASHKQELLA